jgi:hypothetical protein
MVDFLPPDLHVAELRGVDERFDWLPQASELGWPGVPARPAVPAQPVDAPVRPETTIILAAELSDHTPACTWGESARVAVRAAALGYGLAATIHGESLDDVLAALRAAPVRLSDDELSRLGVVLILRRVDRDRRRVVAAHYLRPVARDGHGHVQRLGPAVLATWDATTDRFEQFGWGVTPELALRVGRRAGDFERERDDRRAFLDDLVARGVIEVADVRAAIHRYRSESALQHTTDQPHPPHSPH